MIPAGHSPAPEAGRAMMVCKRVTYGGRVQGVGFRYTAQRLAGGFPVAGYVHNLPGGGVELVAEGEADSVEAFLAAVARRMADNIEQIRVQDEAPGGYHEFRIRY
jgi:acylphosphatase